MPRSARVQNRVLPIFRAIASACAELPAQLVISLGGGGVPEDLGDLPGAPLVVPFAPQLELLERALLVITHAGMNTTVESLGQGVPLVAVPITNDQPAVAARIVRSGCGAAVPLRRATVARLSDAIARVFHDPGYTERARAMADCNRRAGGVPRAADIIEGVV